MTSFVKGMSFTMGGKEYVVLNEGGSDPSSCLVYAPRNEMDMPDPFTLRMWKAEAKLARGDIVIGDTAAVNRSTGQASTYFPPVLDPLEQIAQLKKRIQAIEKRRVNLFRSEDPSAQILLQDNIVRPNKVFDIWAYARSDMGSVSQARSIQYIKLRGLILALTGQGGIIEHFLFNISDQLAPTCRISGDTLSSEGKIRIDLSPKIQTIQGSPTRIISDNLDGRVELTLEVRLACQYASGQTIIQANILQAAYIREVNGPGLKTARLAFPEIGEHMIAIEGICVDIYAGEREPERGVIQ